MSFLLDRLPYRCVYSICWKFALNEKQFYFIYFYLIWFFSYVNRPSISCFELKMIYFTPLSCSFLSFCFVFVRFFFLAFCFFFFFYISNMLQTIIFLSGLRQLSPFREHERNKILPWLLHHYEKDNVFYFKKLYSLTKDKEDNTNSVLQKRETIKKNKST